MKKFDIEDASQMVCSLCGEQLEHAYYSCGGI